MPGAAGALLALAIAGGDAPADCALLSGRMLGGAQVLSVAVEDRTDAPPFCRVALEARPIAGSQIGVEVWLPTTGWNGRFVQLGTGGFAGTLPEAGMAAEVRRGNAVAVTDTGHKGADGFDASWALGAPAKVVDYGHRSLPISARAAKAAVRAFYGQGPRYSYFVGCSNGGRQALVAAQLDPQAWDGILAGAPAVRWTEQLVSFARIQHALRSRPGAMIPVTKLQDIAQTGGDGRRAGLTPDQAWALALIAQDFDPLTAATPGGWDQWIVNPDRGAQTQLTLAEQFFGHVVLGRPGWRVEDLTPVDIALARRLAPIIDVKDSDLGRFRRLGGKLIIYSGAADPVISPKSAVDYYRQLGVQDFARLFVIPGMLHCQGGPEPNAFGQAPIAPALRDDPEHDVRRALEAWVETGRVPERLAAVKYADDDPARGVAARQTIEAFGP